MRLDELPTSDRIEDRRGGLNRIPGGRGGIGIGTIVVLGLKEKGGSEARDAGRETYPVPADRQAPSTPPLARNGPDVKRHRGDSSCCAG
jgi:hypothetical protein